VGALNKTEYKKVLSKIFEWLKTKGWKFSKTMMSHFAKQLID
jgi:hypothetical protein